MLWPLSRVDWFYYSSYNLLMFADLFYILGNVCHQHLLSKVERVGVDDFFLMGILYVNILHRNACT